MDSFETNLNITELVNSFQSNPSFNTIEQISRNLGILKQASLIPVIELVRNKALDNTLRLVWTVRILCNLEKSAVPALIDFLNDQDFEVRGVCVEVLGCLRDLQAVEPVSNLLKDPSDWVRLHAVDTLGFLRDERAIDSLLERLNDRGDFVISHVTDALVAIGGRTYEAVVEIAKNPSQDKISRSSAIITIGKFHNSDSLAFLSSLLNDSAEEFEVRHAAAFSLGRIKNPAALKDLTAALQDPNKEIRAIAAHALGDLGNKDAVEPLLRSLKSDEDGRVRSIVTDSLGALGDNEIIPDLTQVMQTDTKFYSQGMSVSDAARHPIGVIQRRNKTES